LKWPFHSHWPWGWHAPPTVVSGSLVGFEISASQFLVALMVAAWPQCFQGGKELSNQAAARSPKPLSGLLSALGNQLDFLASTSSSVKERNQTRELQTSAPMTQ
jgi:hypothetical protein